MYLYLILLYKLEAHFEKVDDFFDNISSSLKGMVLLGVYEAPEKVDDLLVEGEEIQDLRTRAVDKAVSGAYTKALQKFFHEEGDLIVLSTDQIKQILQFDPTCLMVGIENEVRISSEKNSTSQLVKAYYESVDKQMDENKNKPIHKASVSNKIFHTELYRTN